MALSDLRREGVIEPLPGRGWLIRGRPPAELLRLRGAAAVPDHERQEPGAPHR
jgi:hypothetical protein